MKNNNTSKILSFIFVLILIPIFFSYSFRLISAYTDGDQRHYRAFYEALKYTPASEVMLAARAYVNASEPLTVYLFWTAAQSDIDKDIFITILNILLLLGLYLAAKKHKASSIAILLLLTNFYVIVLMTGAERLKVAYILLFWAIYLSGKKKLTLIGISPLAHLQSFIIFPSILLASLSKEIKRIFSKFKLNKSMMILIIISIAAIIGLYLSLSEGIIRKATGYMLRDTSPAELANLVILSCIAFIATIDRWRMSLLLLPMYPAIFLLGGMRVNMIAVTLVLYFLMEERKLNHPFVMALLVYFSIKSIPFVEYIFLYGNGFANL